MEDGREDGRDDGRISMPHPPFVMVRNFACKNQRFCMGGLCSPSAFDFICPPLPLSLGTREALCGQSKVSLFFSAMDFQLCTLLRCS